MALARVSTKGQLVIPKALREELGIGAGTHVAVRDDASGAALDVIGDDPVEAAYGALAHLGPMTPGLVEEHRRELELEERKTTWPPRAQ